jgi:hypothetical protein
LYLSECIPELAELGQGHGRLFVHKGVGSVDALHAEDAEEADSRAYCRDGQESRDELNPDFYNRSSP